MRQPFSRLRATKEGRDAVIAERLQGAPPATCPYRPNTQSRRYWEHGAARATDFIDKLERIGQ